LVEVHFSFCLGLLVIERTMLTLIYAVGRRS
jgi:hypothetical protein